MTTENTESQLKVIYSNVENNLCIIACAGAGKTTTILKRIVYLITECHVKPNSILLTTFTSAAADDMKIKLEKMIGNVCNELLIGTIDSIALRIITEHNLLTDKLYFVQEYIHILNNFLESSESIFFKESIKFMFVDEFQDINDEQFFFIDSMYKSGTKICAVGDDYQNIYTFRDSNIDYILNFEKYFNMCEIHTLSDNFRSTQEIIHVCNDIIAPNSKQIHKSMIGHRSGKKPEIILLSNKKKQYYFIHDTIKKLKLPLDKVAILSRNNNFLRDTEEYFCSKNVPNVFLNTIEDFQTKSKKNHLVISTFHKSKGLQWDTVFILGLDDEFFPNNIDVLEEERRLLYVGASRAENNLYFIIGDTPTRFLKDIKKDNSIFIHTDFDTLQISKTVDERKERKQDISMTYQEILKLKPELNSFTYETFQLKNRIKIPHFINSYDLYQEFMILLTLIFKKKYCKYIKVSENLKNLFYTLNYVKNRVDNETLYEILTEHGNEAVNILNNNLMTTVNIINTANSVCNILKINPLELRVLKYNPLKEYFDFFRYSLAIYKNKNSKWQEILSHCYKLAIAECVVQKRSKALYLNPYNDWLENIKDDLIFLIDELNVILIDAIDHGDYMTTQNSVILWKYSSSNSLKGEWVLDLLKYNKIQDKQYGIIINPLFGTIVKITYKNPTCENNIVVPGTVKLTV
jgi:hypothetical protein